MDYDLFASLEQSMDALWFNVVQFVPQLIIAILVLILGWIIGGILGGVVRKLFKTLRLDTALDKAGVDELSKKAGYAFKPAKFAGELVKWFVVLVVAIVALDILHLEEVTVFMREVVLEYLPLVFAAVLILFAGLIIAKLVKTAVTGMVRTGGSRSPEFFGKIAYYAVIIFAVMAALNQMKIAEELVQTLFMGIVFALSLGSALAFGLGGREAAGRLVEKMTRK
jgi:hypothetical protein